MCEKEREYIIRAVKEPLELERYEELAERYHPAENFLFRDIPVTLFRIRGISGISVPESRIILASFDDRLPVDSESKKRGTVDYNWRDYFGRLELRDCILRKGLFGKMKLRVKKYGKIIFSTEMWENKEQISIWEELGMKGGEWQ